MEGSLAEITPGGNEQTGTIGRWGGMHRALGRRFEYPEIMTEPGLIEGKPSLVWVVLIGETLRLLCL